MIALLEPIFKGEWAPLAETLICAPTPPVGAVLVAQLLREPGLLDTLIRHHARRLGAVGQDLRPAASAWSLAYLDVLLPPMVAAASVLQHRFPAHAECISVLLSDDGAPLGFHIGDTGSALSGTDTATRFDPLIRGHLEPLFAAISRQTRLAGKILWGNAARRLEGIFEQALQFTGNATDIAQDRDHLLLNHLWSGGCANRLYGKQRVVISADNGHSPAPLKLHRQCCLYYLLPDEGFCGACPLAPQHHKLRGAEPPA